MHQSLLADVSNTFSETGRIRFRRVRFQTPSSVPLTLHSLFLAQKRQGTSEKSKDFPTCRSPKIIGKESKKCTKKQGKSQNDKSKEDEKSKDWKVRVKFLALTEFRGESSVSSFWPVICVPKRTHPVFRRTHRVCPKTQ